MTLPQYASTDVEGLDAETAKRRLQATALNLGRTDQVLAAANVFVTIAWARLLSRVQYSFCSFRGSVLARKDGPGGGWWYAGILSAADIALSLLRWAIRRRFDRGIALIMLSQSGRPRASRTELRPR